MLGIKNYLFIGIIYRAIKKVVVLVFKAIYALISLFNLQLTALILVVGIILYLTGVLDRVPILLTLFYILIILSVIYAILATLKKLLHIDSKKKSKGEGVQIVSKGVEQKESVSVENDNADKNANNIAENSNLDSSSYNSNSGTYDYKDEKGSSPVDNAESNNSKAVKYFKVKQNPNYVMAEYADRYELFYKTESGLKYIRTDYKE